MKDTLTYLWVVITHPRVTFAQLARQPSIHPAAILVLGYGIVLSLMFFISYLSRDYPPPPDELEVWIEAWGEFTMLPFLKIPAEQYRLFQAIIMVPLFLAIWMLMAGTARLLGKIFGGQVTFDQYLNLLAFSFFPFGILASLLDTTFNLLFGSNLMPALQGSFGPFVACLARNFEPTMYVILYGLAGVYNALAAHTAELQAGAAYTWWKSGLVGLLTFAWPTVLVAVLFR